MAPSGPIVAISCLGRLIIAKYWGKSLVTICTTFRGRSGRSGGCWRLAGLQLRCEDVWWKGEECWGGWDVPSLEADRDPPSFFPRLLLWPPRPPPKTTPDGIGDEFVVEVAVEDDIEASVSSINSWNFISKKCGSNQVDNNTSNGEFKRVKYVECS